MSCVVCCLLFDVWRVLLLLFVIVKVCLGLVVVCSCLFVVMCWLLMGVCRVLFRFVVGC